jgi:hypothetical protein
MKNGDLFSNKKGHKSKRGPHGGQFVGNKNPATLAAATTGQFSNGGPALWAPNGFLAHWRLLSNAKRSTPKFCKHLSCRLGAKGPSRCSLEAPASCDEFLLAVASTFGRETPTASKRRSSEHPHSRHPRTESNITPPPLAADSPVINPLHFFCDDSAA